MKKKLITVLMAALLLNPVQAYAGNYLTESYLEAESIPAEPFLCATTAYTQGHTCCGGVKVREGIAAGMREWYGMVCVLYEAVPDESGYRMGDAIGTFQVLDTGYGRSAKDGIKSAVRKDKAHRGTIEVGQCIDIYRSSYSRAVEWMEKTGGKCFIQLVSGNG